jgi:uncharacterized protein YggE
VVTGTGRVAIEPEVATLEVGVSLQGPDLARTRDEAATKVGAARAHLAESGVADTDIRTARLNVRTSFDRQARRQTYHLSTALRATIRDLASAEAIVNDLFGAIGDGMTMNGLTFGVEDPTTGRAEAIALAFEDAKGKAQQLAQLAGTSLGPVLAISETAGDGLGYGQPMMAMSRSADAGHIPVAEGELDQEATVTVQWAFET